MEYPKIIATPDMSMLELGRKLLKADTVQAPVVESNDVYAEWWVL